MGDSVPALKERLAELPLAARYLSVESFSLALWEASENYAHDNTRRVVAGICYLERMSVPEDFQHLVSETERYASQHQYRSGNRRKPARPSESDHRVYENMYRPMQ